MRFSNRYWYSSDNLVLENKSLDAFKDPEEDEEDADILDPCKLDGFPEAGMIGGWRQLRQEYCESFCICSSVQSPERFQLLTHLLSTRLAKNEKVNLHGKTSHGKTSTKK